MPYFYNSNAIFPSVEVATTAKISQLCTSACGALGDIVRSRPLPLPLGDLPVDLEGKLGTPEATEVIKGVLNRGDSGSELTQVYLVLSLSKLLTSAKEIKASVCLSVCTFKNECSPQQSYTYIYVYV